MTRSLVASTLVVSLAVAVTAVGCASSPDGDEATGGDAIITTKDRPAPPLFRAASLQGITLRILENVELYDAKDGSGVEAPFNTHCVLAGFTKENTRQIIAAGSTYEFDTVHARPILADNFGTLPNQFRREGTALRMWFKETTPGAPVTPAIHDLVALDCSYPYDFAPDATRDATAEDIDHALSRLCNQLGAPFYPPPPATPSLNGRTPMRSALRSEFSVDLGGKCQPVP